MSQVLNIDNLHFKNQIGKGFSATIQEVVHENQKKAVKILDLKNERVQKEFKNEIRVYETIGNNPYTLQYFGSAIKEEKGYILLEKGRYNGWELLKFQASTGEATEETFSDWFSVLLNVAKALEILHNNDFIYRDLHLSNILIVTNSEGKKEGKLFDFGGTMKKEEEGIKFGGSLKHSPPEILSEKLQKLPLNNYSSSADIYMFGMCCFELLHLFSLRKQIFSDHSTLNFHEISQFFDQNRIFQGKSEEEVIQLILNGERPKIEIPDHLNIDQRFISLIEKCLSQKKEDRPTISDLILTFNDLIDNNKEKNLNSFPNDLFAYHLNLSFDDRKTITSKTETSNHLFHFDEVYSCLQKAIRRGNVEETIYWAMEFDLSGCSQAAIDRLTVIGSEDQSLALLQTPLYLWNDWNEFNQLNDAAKKGCYCAIVKQRFILVRMAEILAKMNTCRTTNNSCCVSMGLVQKKIDECEEYLKEHRNLSREEKDGVLNGFFMNIPSKNYLGKFTEFATHANQFNDQESEEEALFLLQRLYMEKDSEKWHNLLWNQILQWNTIFPETKENIRSLHRLFTKNIGGESGTRLRIFHALLLFAREKFFYNDEGKLKEELPISNLNENDVLKLYHDTLTKSILEGRWKEGIPDYCVDRHCKRGKGKGADDVYHYGADTTDEFFIAAKEWNVDVSDWSKEEIAKSHGEGKKWFKNQKVGQPTLISQFFDVGSSVVNEIYRSPPGIDYCYYRQRAKEYYLLWEEIYGSLEAKSVRIMATQRALIANLQSNN